MTYSDLQCRPGIFAIPEQFFIENSELVMKALSNFLILRSEFNYLERKVRYEGYSMLFDENCPTRVVPEYLIKIEEDGETMAIRLP